MAKGRELKGRIKSVENTRKITRTLEMVATYAAFTNGAWSVPQLLFPDRLAAGPSALRLASGKLQLVWTALELRSSCS